MADYVIIHKAHDDRRLGESFGNGLEIIDDLHDIPSVSYTLPLGEGLGTAERTRTYVTDYEIVRNDEYVVQAGIHTGVKPDRVANTLQVSGKGWKHYLEQRVFPFDPLDPFFFDFTMENQDIYDILTDMLDVVLAQPGSLDFTYNFGQLGATTNYKIEKADTETIASKVDALAEFEPGFEVEITNDREILLHTPTRGEQRTYRLIQGENVDRFEYEDTGILATRFVGTSSGSAGRLGAIAERVEATDLYRLMDAIEDMGTVTDLDFLVGKVAKILRARSYPVVDLSAIVKPEDTNLWAELSVGDLVWCEGDTGYEEIKEWRRLASMQATVSLQGTETFTLTMDSQDAD